MDFHKLTPDHESPSRSRSYIAPGRNNSRGGFSLVELMVVFTIMTIALSMFSRTLSSASKLDPLSRERSAAAEAAKNMVERMRGYDFAEVYACFNADPLDDPAGEGTAPGNIFDVEGLTAVTPEDRVGEIVFCDTDGQILEYSELTEFGLPRDLSGDGVIDKDNHVSDCIILPFKVRVEWTSRYGARVFELYGVLSNL